jgi:uncharacterized protein YuzE
MKLSYNKESDALYFLLDETVEIVDSEEVRPGVVLDLDKKGNVLGVEILNASKITTPDALSNAYFEIA